MNQQEFESNLRKYAEVLLKVGLNIQPHQRLLIGHSTRGNRTELEMAPLVRVITEQAYKMGIPLVEVMWDDRELNRLRVEHAAEETLGMTVDGRFQVNEEFGEKGDAMLSIYAEDPDLYEGLDLGRVSKLQTGMRQRAHKMTNHAIGKNATNWLLASAPLPGWSQKIFPGVSPEEAKAKHWDAIFKICRVYENDPVAAFKANVKQLGIRAKALTQKRYDALKYTAPGTELTIGLPKGHIWKGGGQESANGIFYVANVPTEEVYTLPDRLRVNGTVQASKPLNLGGVLVDNFSLTFAEGKVVDLQAKEGEEALRNLVNTDESASYLGEAALVPHSSPISQSNILFYNTLYDENAANHLALGTAYRTSLKGGVDMTDDEFMAAGGNVSLIHTDFMIGSGEMDVDGIHKDGTSEAVMRNGEWAFDN
ncbi:MAG: aminopeptidase [Chloroflexota bacterium]